MPANTSEIRNLIISCCFSCKLENVIFFQYGFKGSNLIGKSYLHNINSQLIQLCCQTIFLDYHSPCASSWDYYLNQAHDITISQLIMHQGSGKPALVMHMDSTRYIKINVILANSTFHGLYYSALEIKNRCFFTTTEILIINCTFKFISTDGPIVKIYTSSVNRAISFVNCSFNNNQYLSTLIMITVEQKKENSYDCKFVNQLVYAKNFSLVTTNISFIRCHFIDNRKGLLTVVNKLMSKANVLIESLRAFNNSHHGIKIISITNMNVHIKGSITFFRK